MPGSLLGLWASLTFASVVCFAAGYFTAFVWNYLYLSGGHW